MDDPVELLSALVAIPSVNRNLDPTATGESNVADFCSDWLSARGFAVERLEVESGRPSLLAVASGAGNGRSILLNGHLDTVGVATYAADPFTTVFEGGNIYGRGTFDMKGGLAALLVAGTRAARHPLSGDVILALVADEEFGSTGTEEVVRVLRPSPNAAIVVEPSGLELTIAHRGFAWFEVELKGRAAHGSQPELGIDAIAAAAGLLDALSGPRGLADRLRSSAQHPLLGRGTVRVAMIQGGTDAATVASSCTLTIERRTLPGETPDAVEAELRALVDGVVERVPGLSGTLTRLVARAAFEADPSGAVVDVIQAAAAQVLGRPLAVRGEPFWTDAGLLAEAGIPCVVFGVDGGGAHADVEWATEQSVRELTDVLEAAIVAFCR